MRRLALIATLWALEIQAAEQFSLTSPAFKDQQSIPIQYTCQGGDDSPPLVIQGVPAKTQSLALTVEDPDATERTFIHWVVWNIDPKTRSLSSRTGLGTHGQNTFGTMGWRGPCPPPGAPHHYVFKLYALDTTIDLPDGSIKEQLDEKMAGHILDTAELTGTFKQ